jgi:hypothetical protein
MVLTTKESLTISLKTIHLLQRSYEKGIAIKESLTISLKTIHWLQRSCEWGITTKESLTKPVNGFQ